VNLLEAPMRADTPHTDSADLSLRHAGREPGQGLIRWVRSLRYLGSEVSQAGADVGAGVGHMIARLATILVSVAVFCLVAVTSIAGYWASFIGLHTFAVSRMGYDALHAWLVPVAIDGAALGLSISATVLAWRRATSPLISLLIMLFTSVSSWINYEHITDPVGRQAAALLPFAAVILLEVLLGLLRKLRGDRPRGLLARTLAWPRQLLAETAPHEAQAGYLLVRAALHPLRAWLLLRATFTLPYHQRSSENDQALRQAPKAPADLRERAVRKTPHTAPGHNDLTRKASASPAARDTDPAVRSTSSATHPTPSAAREDIPAVRSDDAQVREDALKWIAAERAAGRQPTGAEVGERFNRTSRWGRLRLEATRDTAA
jgi:hypothetical protein